MGANVQTGKPGWTFDATTKSNVLDDLEPGYAIAFYQSLLQAADYRLVEFSGVPFSAPYDYIISNNTDGCYEPYAGVPADAFLTTAFGPADFNIGLLQTKHGGYPGPALIEGLFNDQDGSPPGLGIYEPDFFNGFRAWEVLPQVLPEGWSTYESEGLCTP